jgi:hypothetical protein
VLERELIATGYAGRDPSALLVESFHIDNLPDAHITLISATRHTQLAGRVTPIAGTRTGFQIQCVAKTARTC